MTDQELQQLLPDYLAGRLDSDSSRAIKERCEQSPEMRLLLEEAIKYSEALGAIEPIRAPADFLDKVHRRITEPKGLFDRLFKPFQLKLPIELAGVAITVLLVVLIYNPFSGKLPQQLVKQRAAEYEERQSTPTANLSAPAEEAAAERSAPKKDEVPGTTAPAQSNQPPRSTATAKAQPAASQQVPKKDPTKSAALPTIQPSAKAMSEKPEIRRLTDESFAPEPTEPASRFLDGDKSKKSAIPNLETESAPQPSMPARRTNSASGQSTSSSAPRMRKQETARGASSSGMGYPAPDADVLMEDAAPEMEAAPAVRSERIMSFSKRSKEYAAEQPAATIAPQAEMKMQQPEQPGLLPQVEQTVHRYRGTVDSIFVNHEDQVKIKISIPPKKLVELKKVLSDSYVNPVFSDFLSGSSDRKVIIIVEITRQ